MMVLKERCSYADVYFLYHFSILFYSSSRLLEKNPMFGNSEGRKNLIADESGQKTTAGLVCTDREAMISQVTGLHSCDK